MLPTNKQMWTFIVLLLVLLMLSIRDFSVMGIPWDREIQTKKYPDIAVDIVKLINRPPDMKWKLSKKRLTLKK